MGRLDEVIKLINLYRVTGQAPDPNLIEELEHLKREEKLLESAMAFAESLTHSPVKTTPVILPPPPPPPAWISNEDPIHDFDRKLKEQRNLIKISQALGLDANELIEEYETLLKERNLLVQTSRFIEQLSSPDTDELIEDIDPISEEVIEEPVQKVEEQPKPKRTRKKKKPVVSSGSDLIDKSVQVLTQEEPKSEIGHPPIEWNQLDTRFKKLENWVSKISNAGPGSGETWLKRLDDVKFDGFPILGQVLTFDGKYWTNKDQTGGPGTGIPIIPAMEFSARNITKKIPLLGKLQTITYAELGITDYSFYKVINASGDEVSILIKENDLGFIIDSNIDMIGLTFVIKGLL